VIELFEFINSFGGRLDDIDQPFVGPLLEGLL